MQLFANCQLGPIVGYALLWARLFEGRGGPVFAPYIKKKADGHDPPALFGYGYAARVFFLAFVLGSGMVEDILNGRV